LLFVLLAAISEAFDYDRFFSVLSTLFAFFFSLAALANCLRIAFCEALDYDTLLKDLSTSGVAAELRSACRWLLPPGVSFSAKP
jgi:hypothetical protein